MNSIDRKWRKSQLYKNALATFNYNSIYEFIQEDFEHSEEFRNARHAFRKQVNNSWNTEAC